MSHAGRGLQAERRPGGVPSGGAASERSGGTPRVERRGAENEGGYVPKVPSGEEREGRGFRAGGRPERRDEGSERSRAASRSAAEGSERGSVPGGDTTRLAASERAPSGGMSRCGWKSRGCCAWEVPPAWGDFLGCDAGFLIGGEVPPTMMLFSSVEGPISRSARKRSACCKILYFTIWNVFFVNVLSGSVISQLDTFFNPKDIPTQLAKAVPRQATFFITYVLTSGWTSLSSEVVQLFQLIYIFVKKNIFRSKIDSSCVMSFPYHTEIPRVLLFGLLGFTCSILAPLILPFLLVYFFLGYIVYRNQDVIEMDREDEQNGRMEEIHTQLLSAYCQFPTDREADEEDTGEGTRSTEVGQCSTSVHLALGSLPSSKILQSINTLAMLVSFKQKRGPS